jgi:hypothetical protein
MTAACDLVPRPVMRWATAPDRSATSFDTYDGVCAWVDDSLLLAGANLYYSLDGGEHWHPSGHRDAPAPTAGLAGEIARLSELELPGYGEPYLAGGASAGTGVAL